MPGGSDSRVAYSVRLAALLAPGGRSGRIRDPPCRAASTAYAVNAPVGSLTASSSVLAGKSSVQ
jgi:hypothetical protein